MPRVFSKRSPSVQFFVVIPFILLCFIASTLAAEQGLPTLPSAAMGQVLFVADDVYSSSENNTSRNPKAQPDVAARRFQQAREHCQRGDVGAALRWATLALQADPNHEGARRVLGYRRVTDHWAGRYAARRLERGEVWNPEYGWIRGDDLPRYEAGERPQGKRWISAEDDAKRHAKIDVGWAIRTDRFRVLTNYNRRDASELATRLETLYQIWQQMFGDFYLEAPKVLDRFDGKSTSGYRSKPFQVVYYRNQQEYVAALRRQQPRIGISLGIYFDTTKTSHFFAGPKQDTGTIFHEAVHQMFHESARSARDVGALSNAWLIEGVACYFESLTERHEPTVGRFFTLGTPGEGRLPAARHRLLVDNYYVPLAELSTLGLTDLQRRKDLAQLYSQSAGLATFLIHGRQSEYRPALVKLLKLIYTGRDKPRSLEILTGRSFADLDQQYREYLEGLPSSAAPKPQ